VGIALAALLGALLGVFSGAGPACAAEPAPAGATVSREQWKQLVNEGNALYQVGRFREALERYERAHVARPTPSTLYNIGQCHRELGQYDRALRSFAGYLVLAPAAPNRADVEALMAELEGLLKSSPSAKPAVPSSPSSLSSPSSPPAPSAGAPSPVVPPAATPAAASLLPGPAAEPAPASARPWYRRWYVWTVVGAVVLGGVVAGAVAGSRPAYSPPPGSLDRPMTYFGGP
jgi:tetratricopeptide (TPR) repeat protein